MTATITVNRMCSRCPREERQQISLKEASALGKSGLKKPSAVRVIVDGEDTFELDTLCSECRQIVGKYLKNINKKMKHRSSLREARTDDVEEDVDAGKKAGKAKGQRGAEAPS